MRAFRRFAVTVTAMLWAGCTLEPAGVDPVEHAFNFPAEVLLSPQLASDGAPAYLFVANENFDLRYNGGTVMSFDAKALADAVRSTSSCIVGSTTPCQFDPATFELNEVRTGSFPGGMAISTRGDRLYVPIRTDGNITYIDVGTDGRLSCTSGGDGVQRCDDAHRRGDETIANQRGEAIPADPGRALVVPLSAFDASAGADAGDAVLVTDVSGAMSLFIDERAPNGTTAPQLIDVVFELASGQGGIAYESSQQLLYTTSSRTNEITRVGVALDLGAHDLRRSFLFKSTSVFLGGLDDGRDSRDIRFDADTGRAYILSRRPEALVVVDMNGVPRNANELAVDSVLELSTGPSRLTIATVNGRKYGFVSCYDARALYVIDLELLEEVGIVRNFSGPFQIAVDSARGLLYVADFRASNLRIVDLSPLSNGDPSSEIGVIATVGPQRARSELH